MRSYTQSILSWGPGFQHDQENYKCQCPVLLDYICPHMPVRVTESEGWRVTQIYGERGRVGSRREVNMIFHCPVFADYWPMKHACCPNILRWGTFIFWSMTNLPRMTGSELPMCTTRLRDDGLEGSHYPSPHCATEPKYTNGVLQFQGVDLSSS